MLKGRPNAMVFRHGSQNIYFSPVPVGRPHKEHGGITEDVVGGEASFSCGQWGELIAHLAGRSRQAF